MALRHYTDEDGRRGIQEIEMILPGHDGRVYVTPDSYDSSREAWRKLALRMPPTGYFEIPEDRLPGLSDRRSVTAHTDQPGGGQEQFVEHAIEVSGLRWREIAS